MSTMSTMSTKFFVFCILLSKSTCFFDRKMQIFSRGSLHLTPRNAKSAFKPPNSAQKWGGKLGAKMSSSHRINRWAAARSSSYYRRSRREENQSPEMERHEANELVES